MSAAWNPEIDSERERDEIEAEARAEALADRDWDGFETARAEDRYLNHMLGRA